MRSVPSIIDRGETRLQTIEGSVPRPTEFIPGCAFAPRCAHAMPVCRENVPALVDVAGSHKAACFLHHSVTEERVHAA
jgi:oligopeptide/dipeptide ABC transporter ATP-binding protein